MRMPLRKLIPVVAALAGCATSGAPEPLRPAEPSVTVRTSVGPAAPSSPLVDRDGKPLPAAAALLLGDGGVPSEPIAAPAAPHANEPWVAPAPTPFDPPPSPRPAADPAPAAKPAPTAQPTKPAKPEKIEQDAPDEDARRVRLARWTPTRGPRDAKVTLVVWTDFQCPFCRRLLPTIEAVRKLYGDDVRVALRHMPLPFHPNAALAAEAAMAAGEQGRFWQMHDLLFQHQDALEMSDLEGYATELGLDVKRFREDLDGRRFQAMVESDARAAAELDISGTPTTFVNGRKIEGAQPEDVFIETIRFELRRADKLLAAGTPREGLYDAIIDRIPDPATRPEPRAAVQVGDAPARGPEGAPITIVEFADFQCPYCARAQPTLQALEAKYKGRLRVVFMNDPLPFHHDAPLAAEAAMAAHAQGRFWPMHDLLFSHEGPLTRDDLARYASVVGLDMKDFLRTLDEGSLGARVQRDVEEAGRLRVNGTPTFFINGVRLDGAQPPSRFEQIIDKELAALPAATPPSKKAAGDGKPRKKGR